MAGVVVVEPPTAAKILVIMELSKPGTACRLAASVLAVVASVVVVEILPTPVVPLADHRQFCVANDFCF